MHKPLDFRDQPHGQQGVPADLEESIVESNIVSLEQSLPDSQDIELEKGARANGLAGIGRAFHCGFKKSSPVDLAVGSEREGADEYESRGHHVIGEPLGEMVARTAASAVAWDSRTM